MANPYQGSKEFSRPWDAVFEAAKRSIARFPKMVLLAADPTTGRVAVAQGITLRANAASIVIDVGHVSSQRTIVRVWSAVPVPYDPFGRNRSNVKEILSAIEQELAGVIA